MMSGTSTGSILTTGLSVQSEVKNVPKYWAKDCVNIYIQGGPQIFQQNKLGAIFQYLCYVCFVILFASVFYCCGKSRYDNSRKQKALKEMHNFLIEQQEKLEVKRAEHKKLETARTFKMLKAQKAAGLVQVNVNDTISSRNKDDDEDEILNNSEHFRENLMVPSEGN